MFTTTMVTNGAGTVLQEQLFDPWGVQGTYGGAQHDLHFASLHQIDPDLGTYPTPTRNYLPRIYRWLTPDEFTGGPSDATNPPDPAAPGPLPYADITNPQTLNKYAYTWNNPLRYTDPNGHIVDILLDVASATYSAAAVVADVITGSDDLGTDLKALGADVVGAALPGLTGLGAAVRAAARADKAVDAARLAENAARGKAAEKVVLEAEGLTKNRRALEAVDPKTGKLGKTIPDAFRESGHTVDVKDVKRLADSPQLRRQSVISGKKGQKAEVIVTDRTQRVSKTVQRRMDVRPCKILTQCP